MSEVLSMNSTRSLNVIIGTTNKIKIKAIVNALDTSYPGVELVLHCIKSDPGIKLMEDDEQIQSHENHILFWKSKNAIGQPFTAKQTAFGAINRLNDAFNQYKSKHKNIDDKSTINTSETNKTNTDRNTEINNNCIFASENGLVSGQELGFNDNLNNKQDIYRYDIVYVAYCENDLKVIQRGDF